jgi:hypothetical protein
LPWRERPGVQVVAHGWYIAAKLSHLHLKGMGDAAGMPVSAKRAPAPLCSLGCQGMLI